MQGYVGKNKPVAGHYIAIFHCDRMRELGPSYTNV